MSKCVILKKNLFNENQFESLDWHFISEILISLYSFKYGFRLDFNYKLTISKYINCGDVYFVCYLWYRNKYKWFVISVLHLQKQNTKTTTKRGTLKKNMNRRGIKWIYYLKLKKKWQKKITWNVITSILCLKGSEYR